MILYNASIRSPGRIRFTQGHELGHYILHRLLRDELKCTEADTANWSKDDVDVEGQADPFASYLLMLLDDYRKQVDSEVNLDVFLSCADRYGVSLTAAILMRTTEFAKRRSGRRSRRQRGFPTPSATCTCSK